MFFLLLTIISWKNAMADSPNLRIVPINHVLETDGELEVVMTGIGWTTTTGVVVNNLLIDFTLYTSPCETRIARNETCKTLTIQFFGFSNYIMSYDCSTSITCIKQNGSPCSVNYTDICTRKRCYAVTRDFSGCVEYVNSADGESCAPDDSMRCSGGACINAKTDACESNITASMPMPIAGKYNATIITNTTGVSVTNDFIHVLQFVRLLTIASNGADVFTESTEVLSVFDTPLSPLITSNWTYEVFFAGQKVVDNRCPNLDFLFADDQSNQTHKSFDISYVIHYTDYQNVYRTHQYTNPTNQSQWWYQRRAVVYSTCPSAALLNINTTLTLQGEFFVDSPTLTCEFGGQVVPVIFINSHFVTCFIYPLANMTSNIVRVSNDNNIFSASSDITVTISGDCETTKPNSVPYGDQCICQRGYMDSVGGKACIPCPDGTYQPDDGQIYCIPCDVTESTGGTEANTDGSSCRCRDGRYRVRPTDTTCELCVDELICENGTIAVREGFWRASGTDTYAMACGKYSTDKRSCVGGSSSGDILCAKGYAGPFCNVCGPGYGLSGRECVECRRGESGAVVALVVIVSLVVIFGLIKITTNDSNWTSESGTVSLGTVIKIVVNYLQMLFYIGNIEASWSRRTTTFLSMLVPTVLSPSFASFQCASNMDFYTKMAITMLLPVISVVFLALCLLTIACTPLDWRPRGLFFTWQDLMLIVIIVLYIIHPTISLDVLRSLQCEQVKGTGTSFVKTDMSVDCKSDAYLVYYPIAVTYIILYIILFPLLIGKRMYTMRDDIYHLMTANTGFEGREFLYLVRGYTKQAFLWEGSILFRKLSVVAASVLLPKELQLLWSYTIIGIALAATVKLTPYKSIIDNRMEIIALTTLCFVLVLAFHSSITSAETSQAQTAIFVLLVASTMSALAFMILIAWNRIKKGVKDNYRRLSFYISNTFSREINTDVEMKTITMQSRENNTKSIKT